MIKTHYVVGKKRYPTVGNSVVVDYNNDSTFAVPLTKEGKLDSDKTKKILSKMSFSVLIEILGAVTKLGFFQKLLLKLFAGHSTLAGKIIDILLDSLGSNDDGE